ncbi:MAG: tyrosine-type recombinase/integrase [Candidatus Omnitrophota bacterium]
MAGVRDRGDYWQIWWLVEGKREWGRLEKEEYLKKRDAQNEASSRERDGTILTRRSASFKDYATKFMTNNKKPGSITIEKFTTFINRFDKYLATTSVKYISDITETIFKDYINNCLKVLDYSPTTINRDLEYFKQVMRDAIGRGIIRNLNLKTIKYEKEERKLKILPTATEREKILKWIQKNEPLYYVWIYFVATRGWRQGEFRPMRVSDIDLESKIMYVQHTKTDDPRQENLTREDCIVLNEHFILLKKLKKYSSDGLLIPPRRGTIVSRNTLLRIVKKASKELGITKNITNHIFRHWVVSTILNSGKGIKTVMAITGHKDENTIYKYYAHTTPDDIKDALEITKINTEFVPGRVPEKR